MNKTKMAEQLFTRPEGATMEDVIAVTGDYQYRALKRLKSRGYRISARKDGRVTRYHAISPAAETFEATVTAGGKVTLPKELRERLGLRTGSRLRLAVDADRRLVMTAEAKRLSDLAGILGKPRRTATLEDMDKGIRDAVVERYLRAIGRKR